MKARLKVQELIELMDSVEEAEMLLGFLVNLFIEGQLEPEEYVGLRDRLFDMVEAQESPKILFSESFDINMGSEEIGKEIAARIEEEMQGISQKGDSLQELQAPQTPPTKPGLVAKEPVAEKPPVSDVQRFHNTGRCRNCNTALEPMAAMMGEILCPECARPRNA